LAGAVKRTSVNQGVLALALSNRPLFRARFGSLFHSGAVARPVAVFEIHPVSENWRAFTFQQAPLQCCTRLLKQYAASSSDYSMPRHPAIRRAGSHSPARGASSARQTQSFRKAAVSDDAPLGNTFNQLVNALPGGGRCGGRFAQLFSSGATLPLVLARCGQGI
jgi:hypothetical protein